MPERAMESASGAPLGMQAARSLPLKRIRLSPMSIRLQKGGGENNGKKRE
jgi:hypothetical protein